MHQQQKSFEEAMQELENITTNMQENNKVSLEESLKYYEQGTKLVKFCQEKLKEVEQKIKILNEENDELQDLDTNEF